MVTVARRSKFIERVHQTINPIAKKIFTLVEEKESNLAFSCDVTSCAEVLKFARELGPYISILKTHIDIIEDFYPEFLIELADIAKKESFLIFEDRKFADIGNTVLNQYTKGIYRISSWADIVNAHALPGVGVLQGIRQGAPDKDKGVLLLAQMSSQGSFRNPEYISYVEKMAEANSDLVIGFIAQEKLFLDPRWIWMTPGVKLSEGRDTLGQSYIHPEKAILENGTDIIIVGRDIINHESPVKRAIEYKKIAWNALCSRG